MRNYFAVVIFGFIIANFGMLLWKVERNKKKDINDISKQLKLGIALNLLQVCSLVIDDKELLGLFYSLEEIVQMWILYLFLRHAYVHANFFRKNKKFYRTIATVVVVGDICMLLVNSFTQIFFKINMYEWMGCVYGSAEWSFAYILHYSLMLFCELMIVVVMLRKAFELARVYRTKYLLSGIGFTLLFIAGATLRMIMGNSNFGSVILMSLAIAGYYLLYFRLPQIHLTRMRSFAINKMADPVLMFDYNDTLQIFNDAALQMLGVSENMTFVDFVKDNALSYELKHHDSQEKVSAEFTRTIMLGRKTYLIHGQELWDEKKRFIGTLLTYTDISVSDIANKTGFYDTSHFIKAFLADTGTTPNAYLKESR